jgi:hypothetical protein
VLIQQFHCTGNLNQQWTLNLIPGSSDTYTIRSAWDGLCIEDEASWVGNGVPITQSPCHPDWGSEQWQVRPAQLGYIQLYNVLNARCLDTQFSVDDGTVLVTKDCGYPLIVGGGWWNQQWQLR